MSTYDWPLIQKQAGERIESLIATLLRRKYDNARQVNPSQGDAGIDILRPTDDGLIIWQVKGFTTALSQSQFNQIRKSWQRFMDVHVQSGKSVVAKYHLVTPWTPTEERLEEFEQLTQGASFPAQWDGEAFIAGLADEFPETMDRFISGEKGLETFIYQKAILASAPVEHGSTMSMVEAVASRFEALDALIGKVSDNYRIEFGTLNSSSDSNGLPAIPPVQGAIQHKLKYLGDTRWTYQSVVPRTGDANKFDPISLDITFKVTAGTVESDALVAWDEWGIPFKDLPAEVEVVGGPYSGEFQKNAFLSVSNKNFDDLPTLYLRGVAPDGDTRFRLPLTLEALTRGSKTQWLRLIVSTPEKALSFELRFKTRQEAETRVFIGEVNERNPEAVLAELQMLESVRAEDTLIFEWSSQRTLVQGERSDLPPAFSHILSPIARNLTSLQKYSESYFAMPNIHEITDRELGHLNLLAKIYEGHSHHETWSELSITVPEHEAEAEAVIQIAKKAQDGEGTLVQTENPVFSLGSSTYQISHPLISVFKSHRLASDVDPTNLRPGDVFKIQPGIDPGVTTSRLTK